MKRKDMKMPYRTIPAGKEKEKYTKQPTKKDIKAFIKENEIIFRCFIKKWKNCRLIEEINIPEMKNKLIFDGVSVNCLYLESPMGLRNYVNFVNIFSLQELSLIRKYIFELDKKLTEQLIGILPSTKNKEKQQTNIKEVIAYSLCFLATATTIAGMGYTLIISLI